MRSATGAASWYTEAVERVWNHASERGGAALRLTIDQRAASIGVSVNETNSENSVATTTTTPNSFMNLPTIPERNAIGRNTTTSTSVIATAAPPISLRPLIAASIGDFARGRDGA